ncbi:hypothetical protein RFI_01256, partial [Reticulomyxa filosa]
DADTILLGLLLHEPNVYLLRDVPVVKKKLSFTSMFDTQFQLVDLSILREYLLKYEWSPHILQYRHFAYQPERVLDDWVFLFYFVGNDFIPNLPFINMRFVYGAHEYLMNVYRDICHQLPNYLCDGRQINFDSLQLFFRVLATQQEQLLHTRSKCFLNRSKKERKAKLSSKIKADAGHCDVASDSDSDCDTSDETNTNADTNTDINANINANINADTNVNTNVTANTNANANANANANINIESNSNETKIDNSNATVSPGKKRSLSDMLPTDIVDDNSE